MKSEWTISSQYLGGRKVYQVYRIKDMRIVDHSGNREYAGGLTDDEAAAMALAEELNAEEGKKSEWYVEYYFHHGGSGPTRRYRVVRLIDPAKPDSYENKEYAGSYIKKREANAEAKRLNSEGRL